MNGLGVDPKATIYQIDNGWLISLTRRPDPSTSFRIETRTFPTLKEALTYLATVLE